MPIYEYQTINLKKGCTHCQTAFEMLQDLKEEPLKKCPHCGHPVKRIVSWCRAAVLETSAQQSRVEKKIKDYENNGMWSHAAELADKHSEKTKDKGLKTRALDNYRKAGYDAKLLDKHAK